MEERASSVFLQRRTICCTAIPDIPPMLQLLPTHAVPGWRSILTSRLCELSIIKFGANLSPSEGQLALESEHKPSVHLLDCSQNTRNACESCVRMPARAWNKRVILGMLTRDAEFA